jgi:hypothetical protein
MRCCLKPCSIIGNMEGEEGKEWPRQPVWLMVLVIGGEKPRPKTLTKTIPAALTINHDLN